MYGPKSEASSNKMNSVSNKSAEKTILLVEDDEVLSRMYSQKLIAEGFNVINATNGKEALEKFNKELMDLIITDIMLPKMSGTEFLKEVRSTTKGKDIPVFVWTNLALEEEKRQALGLGANEYLVKESLTLAEVVKLVKKYLN